MRLQLLATAAFVLAPAAAFAQAMPGMDMGPPAQPAQAPSSSGPAAPAGSAAAPGMDHSTMDHSTMDHSAMTGMDHDMTGMDMAMDHGGGMTGALGAYPMNREASGTSWQPDAAQHGGIHSMAGDWMIMSHAQLNAVGDRQSGPRGDDKSFVSGMLMTMATRSLSKGDKLQLRAMLSPDPFMGKRGFPQLLASGETADGVTPLIDRQHPHDLFMELSASYSRPVSETSSVFVYAGLPGEPAFGPPAFMHRTSIMDSPEAPISHHWLDSTHITYGVLTAGYVRGDWKLEASAFQGREPDERRFDIEAPKFDSTALRLSWNPSARWSLQGSWADLKSPEQLEPELDQRRWSVSAIYARPLPGFLAGSGWWSTTAAWGRRSAEHGHLDALILESTVKLDQNWTVFGRGERVETDELAAGAGHHGPKYAVGKVSLGAIYDWRIADHLKVGVGGLYAWNRVPTGLEGAYGGDPHGSMAFIRLKID